MSEKAITMGMLYIMQAGRVLLMTDGTEKREILVRVLHGPVTPKIPASILRQHKELTVACSCKLF